MADNIAERVLAKDLENIIKKAASGKTLTVAERARIESHANGRTESKPYADTVVELAERLGITRRTITNWRKRKDAPKPLSNGKHDISQWREFMRRNGINDKTETPEESVLKARKLLAEVEQAELKLAVMKGSYVGIEKVREVWMSHIGQVRNILESRFLIELPPVISAMDAIQIREKLQEVLDEAYHALHVAASSLKDPVETEE